MKILLATNNKHKVYEIKEKILEYGLEIDLLTLSDVANEKIEIEENGSTLEENALIKAKEWFDLFRIPSVADDSGLEVFSLGGLPGVHSARFAGPNSTDAENRKKLLSLLKGKNSEDRKARFRTVFCFYDGTEPKFFEGVCDGMIIEEERGDNGFGYDSIFLPNGYEITFAQMKLAQKNKISHRSIAVLKFVNFLKEQQDIIK
ncbi:MAG: RdgB/HAM1 family non-canonical purine NTP pyrophosphatase [Candidatus Kapaibacteriota bacterium]